MLSREFKKMQLEKAAGSRIKAANTKADLADLADQTVTLSDYEKLTGKGDDGESKTFYVFTVEEAPGLCFNAGKALNEILDACEEAGEDARGEQIYIGKKIRLDGGRYFTPVNLV